MNDPAVLPEKTARLRPPRLSVHLFGLAVVLVWGLGLVLIPTPAARGQAALPTVRLVAPTDGQVFTAPATVPLAAQVDDDRRQIKAVEFDVGTRRNSKITRLSHPPYRVTWQPVMPNGPGARYALTALVTYADGSRARSAPVRIQVVPPAPTPPPTDRPGKPRRWWVYLTPKEGKALFRSPFFAAIRGDADRYYLNGLDVPRSALDHASRYVNRMGAAQELLSATYFALKWGKYGGRADPELAPYLERIAANWLEILASGPAALYTENLPQHEGMLSGHNEKAPFVPGWYEADIALRWWMLGALPSYDAVRDDLPGDVRATVDTWLATLGDRLIANTYDNAFNRGTSAHGQAQVIALVLQDRERFERAFDGRHGFRDPLRWLTYPPTTRRGQEACRGLFPARPGLTAQLGGDRASDGPHGVGIVSHTFQALAVFAHAARNGGDPRWDVVASEPGRKRFQEVFDTWFAVAGPLNESFVRYCRCLENASNPGGRAWTTPMLLDEKLWSGLAFFDRRFLGIGTLSATDTARWTWPGPNLRGGDVGVARPRIGQEALWKERARLFLSLDKPVGPVPVESGTALSGEYFRRYRVDR